MSTETTLGLLKENLKAGLQHLKAHMRKHKIDKNIHWYVLAGPKGSGKTTLLSKSQLPLTNHHGTTLDNIASTHQCQWWYTKDTAYLDMEAYGDAHIWTEWFKLLMRHNKRHPLDGVVITLDIQDWRNKDNLDHQLNYLDILLQSLHRYSTIPVYLVFTKSDLIAGFREFFEQIEFEDAERSFGIVIPDAFEDDFMYHFLNEYKLLLKRINSKVIWRLHQERNAEKCAAIKNFPAQLACIEHYIRQFIELFDKYHHYQLKGVYFTSGLQQDQPIDFISETFSTTAQLPLASKTQTYLKKPLFVKEIFHDALKPRLTSRTNTSWLPKIIGAAALLTLILFSGALYLSAQHNMTIISRTKKMMNTLSSTPHTDTLSILNTLHATEKQLHHADSARYFYLGSKEIKTLQTETRNTYIKYLHSHFLPQLQQSLETKLRAHDTTHLSDFYSTLRTYIAMSKPNVSDGDFVEHWFKQHWVDDATLTAGQNEQMQQHLKRLLGHFRPIRGNLLLVSHANKILNETPITERVLAIVESNTLQPPVTFEDIHATPIFTAEKYTIPAIYTSQAFYYIYNESIPKTINHIKANSALSDDAVSDLIADTRKLYLKQYTMVWQQLLDTKKISHFDSLTQADRIVGALSQTDSPLFELLKKVKSNTSSIPGAIAFNNTVTKQFYALNQITSHWQEELIQPAFGKLHNYLSTIHNDSDTNRSAFEVAKLWLENSGRNDPVENLKNIAAQLPTPLNAWLNAVADNGWAVILERSHDFINEKWRQKVTPFYDNFIRDRYPVMKNAASDVRLAHFTAFFKPNGILENFYTRYLAVFVDQHDLYWTFKRLHGQSINIPQDSLETFIRGHLISQMFFTSDGRQLKLHFSMVPIGFSENVKDFAIEVGNQIVNYTPGMTQVSNFVWPGQAELAGVKLIDAKQQTFILSKTGPWALFKLVDQAHLQDTSDPKRYKIFFDFNGAQARYALIAAKAINPFMPSILNAFTVPEQL